MTVASMDDYLRNNRLMWKLGGYFFLFSASIIKIFGESDKQRQNHQQFNQCDVQGYHLPSVLLEGRKKKFSLPS